MIELRRPARLMLMSMCVVMSFACGPEATKDVIPVPTRRTNTDFDLGRVTKGSRVEREISVANRSSPLARVIGFQTSCDCLSASPGSEPTKSEERIKIDVRLDLTHEPNFTGRLAVEVFGLDHAKQEVVKFRILVEVVE